MSRTRISRMGVILRERSDRRISHPEESRSFAALRMTKWRADNSPRPEGRGYRCLKRGVFATDASALVAAAFRLRSFGSTVKEISHSHTPGQISIFLLTLSAPAE